MNGGIRQRPLGNLAKADHGKEDKRKHERAREREQRKGERETQNADADPPDAHAHFFTEARDRAAMVAPKPGADIRIPNPVAPTCRIFVAKIGTKRLKGAPNIAMT